MGTDPVDLTREADALRLGREISSEGFGGGPDPLLRCANLVLHHRRSDQPLGFGRRA